MKLNLKYFLTIATLIILSACNDERDKILFNGPDIISLERSELVVSENAAEPASVTVYISRTYDVPVELSFSISEENAIDGIDYEIDQTVITIPAGAYSGTLQFSTIDNGDFDLARRVTVTITSASEESLNLSEQNSITFSILNDDCPVTTSIWAGDITADEDGYIYTATLTPNLAGDCDLLLVDNIGDYGFLGTLKRVAMTFTPESEGATSGTVDIARQPLGIVSDGAGGFTGSGERTVEGAGVYDEATKEITIFLTFRFGNGGVWYESTTIFTGN